MSVRVMSMVWEFSHAKGGDLIIMLAIADHADDHGKAFPGEDRLATKGRMTTRNVRHCLRGLETMGELTIVPGRGRGRANHYQINLEVLTARAKDGNVFLEKITGNVFPENISRKNDALQTIKPEKFDRKTGNRLPPNHHITVSKKEEPSLSSDSSKKPSKSDTHPPFEISPQELIESWNEICGARGLPKITERGAKNQTFRKRITLRLKQYPDLAFWQTVVDNCWKSPFLMGEKGGWKVTLHWLVKSDENPLKVYEGHYNG